VKVLVIEPDLINRVAVPALPLSTGQATTSLWSAVDHTEYQASIVPAGDASWVSLFPRAQVAVLRAPARS